MARNDGISEREFARVEEETGLSKNEQLELLREQMAFSHNMGNRLMDLANRWEDAKQHRIAAKMADKQSIRDFKLAGRQLDLLEKVMAAHFAERKVMIEGGFRTIDRALGGRELGCGGESVWRYVGYGSPKPACRRGRA